jgi:aldose 1-epimerase
LDVYVTYQLSSPYDLHVCATPVNLVNHTYWNLGSHASSDVLGHLIQVHASRYTIVDKSMIPTGEIAGVAGTPYDLRRLTPVGSRINSSPAAARSGTMSTTRCTGTGSGLPAGGVRA